MNEVPRDRMQQATQGLIEMLSAIAESEEGDKILELSAKINRKMYTALLKEGFSQGLAGDIVAKQGPSSIFGK